VSSEKLITDLRLMLLKLIPWTKTFPFSMTNINLHPKMLQKDFMRSYLSGSYQRGLSNWRRGSL